eukprot:c41059_g1_i1 orf=170-382(+)
MLPSLCKETFKQMRIKEIPIKLSLVCKRLSNKTLKDSYKVLDSVVCFKDGDAVLKDEVTADLGFHSLHHK